MKVFFLGLKIFSTGGIEQVCKNWLYALSSLSTRNNSSFHAISLYDTEIDNRYVNSTSIKVCSGNKYKFGILAIWKAITSDVVIIPHLNLSLFVLIAKLINPKIKVFVQLHGIEAWTNLSGVQERMLNQADGIFSVSNFTMNNVLERYPHLKSKSSVLSNSLDPLKDYNTDIYAGINFRSSKGIAESKKLLITVGRLHNEEAYKGYDKTIEAIHLLNDESIEFHIIGKYDKIEQQRIFDMLLKYDMVGQVKLVGYVNDEDLAKYYHAADLFIMPSKGEGFGLVFIDAMANGLRVIGGNADGSVDAISFSSESALINPDDIEEIKNAIQKLLSENWTAEQKINLSTKCKEKFSPEIFEHNIEKTILWK